MPYPIIKAHWAAPPTYIEKTKSLALFLRMHLKNGWMEEGAERQAQHLYKALDKYLKAIGED